MFITVPLFLCGLNPEHKGLHDESNDHLQHHLKTATRSHQFLALTIALKSCIYTNEPVCTHTAISPCFFIHARTSQSVVMGMRLVEPGLGTRLVDNIRHGNKTSGTKHENESSGIRTGNEASGIKPVWMRLG